MKLFINRTKIAKLLRLSSPKWFAAERQENVHLRGDTAELLTLRGGLEVWARPSFSDRVRIDEYFKQIYVPEIQLSSIVRDHRPFLLVDIGANIGLSTWALLRGLPSIKACVGIEAELENFSVLQRNFDLWSGERPDVKFLTMYAVAASSAGKANIKVGRLPGGISASGTFTFEQLKVDERSKDASQLDVVCADTCVSVNEIIADLLPEGKTAVVKVDIEGGESELFEENVEWLTQVAFLTIEVHDRFGVPRSSANLIRCLAQFDFAVFPEQDILHCFNRRLLSI